MIYEPLKVETAQGSATVLPTLTMQYGSPAVTIHGAIPYKAEGYYIIGPEITTEEALAQAIESEARKRIEEASPGKRVVWTKEVFVQTGYYLFGIAGGVIDGPLTTPPDSTYVYAAYFHGKYELGEA